MNFERETIVALVRDALVEAGSTFRADKKAAYARAIANETDEKAKWVLETILENAEAAEKDRAPLCDDTGIPHLLLEVGQEAAVSGYMLDAIREGVAEGLRKLPGRPMGIMGEDSQRIDQSGGLDPDSAGVKPAPTSVSCMTCDSYWFTLQPSVTIQKVIKLLPFSPYTIIFPILRLE